MNQPSTAKHPTPAIPRIVIEPARGWKPLELHDLWRYRELFFFLIWRDVKVRYKQTALGVVWAVLQPLGNMLIFAVLFGRLARLPSDGIPYPLFAFAGRCATRSGAAEACSWLISAAKATEPKPQPAVCRKSRRDVGWS